MTDAEARFIKRLRDEGGVADTNVVLSFTYGWRVQYRILSACRAQGWVRPTLAGLAHYTETLTDAGREALASYEARHGK